MKMSNDTNSSMSFPKLPRSPGKVPFGYTPNPDNPYELLPSQSILEALDEALLYVEANAISLRGACKYIEDSSGASITYEGLRLLKNNKTHPIYDYRQAQEDLTD